MVLRMRNAEAAIRTSYEPLFETGREDGDGDVTIPEFKMAVKKVSKTWSGKLAGNINSQPIVGLEHCPCRAAAEAINT